MKMKIIKWSQNIRRITPRLQGEMIKNPVAIIKGLSHRAIGQHLRGFCGENKVYEDYNYLLLDNMVNHWETPEAYEVELEGICHPNQVKYAYLNGDYKPLEMLFDSKVAVGDLLVIWNGGGVAYNPPQGYVCGERLTWQMVNLADDGDYFRHDKIQVPCIGKRYEREMLESLEKAFGGIG